MYLMMDIEISCKGHCDSFSHFLYLVSYTISSNYPCLEHIFMVPKVFELYTPNLTTDNPNGHKTMVFRKKSKYWDR